MSIRKTVSNQITLNADNAEINICSMDSIDVSTATFTTATTTTANITTANVSGALYPPRLTTAEKNALSVTQGAVVYDTDEEKLYSYDGAAWNVAAGASFDPASLQVYLASLQLIPQSDTTI